jgi:DNA mismatch endonuclease (patch repair protein)
VFSRLKKIIKVRGCFWHSHRSPLGKKTVRTRVSYWHPKVKRNVERDRENLRKLRALGWEVLVVWECEVMDAAKLAERLAVYLAHG